MTVLFQKIKTYLRDHSLKETFFWLWDNVVYRLQKKLSHMSGQMNIANRQEVRRAKNAGEVPVFLPDFRKTSFNSKEATVIAKKNGRNVFIFATIPYYDIGGGQRSAQLAKTFNKMGYSVHYIYAFSSSDFNRKTRIHIPCVMHMHIGALSLQQYSQLVCSDDLVILEGPVSDFVPYAEVSKTSGAKIVYENIDNWETSLGNSVYRSRDDLNHLLDLSDLLVGTAELLVDQLKHYCDALGIKKELIYLPNAVDDELFAPGLKYSQPSDMVMGSKTLLYYGSLWGEWFDWDLIFDIANRNPSYAINLIGDNSGIANICRSAPENIHFLGIKQQTELPAYLKYTDFALIPFKPGEIGNYVSPLKMFEYISMSKIVLSTTLPDIVGYPNVFCGNDAESWMAALESDYTPDITAAEAFTSENTWTSRIDSILNILYPETADRCPDPYFGNISIVVLNYNNKGIIDKCVASLLKFRKRYEYEIVVVDNCSKDGSYEQLSEKFGTEIKLLKNSKNGCSSGRNLGVRESSGDYILFLDSDQWAVGYYWLDTYLNIHATAPNFGAIAWNGGWFNRAGAAYRIVDEYDSRSMPPAGLYRCDIGYLATCGFLMDKVLFNQVGGFDEYYDPTCYEDTDLALKIRHEGKEFYYSPYLGVVHLPHQTTKSGTDAHTRLINEKQRYFTQKWRTLQPDLLEYTK